MRERGQGPKGHHLIINNSHSNQRSWCTFPVFYSHFVTFAWLNMPSSLGPRRSSGCNPTVAYSTPDWELHFSFTTGAEAALEERDILWLGGKLRRTGVGNFGSARWRSRYSHGPRYSVEGLDPIFCIFTVFLAGPSGHDTLLVLSLSRKSHASGGNSTSIERSRFKCLRWNTVLRGQI